MEVHVISRELIKPSSKAIQNKPPHKLSLFDQLTPTIYSSIVLFYTNCDINSSVTKVITHLKKSLVETLDLYYPFYGRTIDNLFIDCYNEGVPFIEAKVNLRLTQFFKLRNNIELLNQLLPCQPYAKELESAPILAYQMNVFACGGIAIASGASHKVIDILTGKAILDTWTSISRAGSSVGVSKPNLIEPSLFFPPGNSLSPNHISLMERLWFKEANFTTRRFVFDAKSIAQLRSIAANGNMEPKKPSRIETLTCFIWLHCMAASKSSISGNNKNNNNSKTTKPSVLVQAVNLRTRTKPPMSNTPIGNIFWWATVVANPNDLGQNKNNNELNELYVLLKEAIELYESEDYMQSLQGNEGCNTIANYCEQLEGLFELEEPDIFAFTSWCNLGVNRTEFGWGEPFWVGLMGKAGPAFRNLTVFVETKDGKGIEAWMTLEESIMSVIEKDVGFLAFASLNPLISSL